MTFPSRLVRVARLDANIYAELRDEPAITWQALTIVVAVAVAHAILGVFYATRGGWHVLRSIIPSLQSEIIFWLVSATVMYLIGTHIFKSPVTYGAVLRTLGFAALPGVLYALGYLSEVILWISWLWRIATIFIAARQVFELNVAKTLVLMVLGGGVGVFSVGSATLATLHALEQLGI